MNFIKNDYLNWAVSGSLMGLVFVVPSFWFLGVLGGVLFLHLFINKPLSKQFAVGVIIAFVIKYLYATSIFWSVYPVNFLPIELGQIQLIIIFLYWFTSALWLGLGSTLLILCKWFWGNFYSQKSYYYILPLFGLVWVASEIVGSFIFSIMMWGPGGSINFAYSLGYSGYALAEHNLLLQFGKLAGVYGLSFLFIGLASLFLILVKKRRSFFATVLFLGLITSSGIFGGSEEIRSEDGQSEIIVIDTNLKSNYGEEISEFEERQALTQALEVAMDIGPDYLLLPEDARFFAKKIISEEWLQNNYPESKTIILDSRTIQVESSFNLEAYIYDSGGDNYLRVSKRYLVPQGEYVPLLYSGLFKLFGKEYLVDYIEENINYTVGDQTSQKSLSHNLPAILFCFESVDPVGVRRLVREHPEAPFIAHPVSHAWFNQSEILWNQLDTMLQVQALWNQRYIISATNEGRSQVYTPEGEVLDMEEVAVDNLWSVKRIQINLP